VPVWPSCGGCALQGWWAASYIVLWLVVVALCVIVVALARQIGTLHLRLGPRGALEMDTEGPPLGEATEPMEAADIDGRPRVVGGPEEPQLLLFVSLGCQLCEQVLPAISAVAKSGDLKPLVITDADAEESTIAFRSRPDAPVIPGLDIGRSYNVPGTPYVVITDRMGVVRAKGTPNNLEQMEGLVRTARRRMTEAVDGGEGPDGSERRAS
jgi:methylamine dehydrogenase accessory protein MauD